MCKKEISVQNFTYGFRKRKKKGGIERRGRERKEKERSKYTVTNRLKNRLILKRYFQFLRLNDHEILANTFSETFVFYSFPLSFLNKTILWYLEEVQNVNHTKHKVFI